MTSTRHRRGGSGSEKERERARAEATSSMIGRRCCFFDRASKLRRPILLRRDRSSAATPRFLFLLSSERARERALYELGRKREGRRKAGADPERGSEGSSRSRRSRRRLQARESESARGRPATPALPKLLVLFLSFGLLDIAETLRSGREAGREKNSKREKTRAEGASLIPRAVVDADRA